VVFVKDFDGVDYEMGFAEAQDRFGVLFECLNEPALEFLWCSSVKSESAVAGQVQKDIACSFVVLD
jgi:hypothetical protein